MSLSDSRSDLHNVMDSAATLSCEFTNRRSSNRVSQVPDCSVGARCLQPPREAAMLHLLVTSHHVLASPSLEGWPPQTLRNEAESSSLALRLTPAHQRASANGLLRNAASSTSRPTSNYHGQYLTIDKNNQTSPGTPETLRKRSSGGAV